MNELEYNLITYQKEVFAYTTYFIVQFFRIQYKIIHFSDIVLLVHFTQCLEKNDLDFPFALLRTITCNIWAWYMCNRKLSICFIRLLIHWKLLKIGKMRNCAKVVHCTFMEKAHKFKIFFKNILPVFFKLFLHSFFLFYSTSKCSKYTLWASCEPSTGASSE